MNIRKNQSKLSPGERTAFVNALLELKRRPSRLQNPTNSRYDDYVYFHISSMESMTSSSPGWAHMGPAFLPWHRYLLRQLELDLQMINPNVTIPYWDWTVDRSPDSGVPGSPWTDDFMGGNGDPNKNNQVTTGPFLGEKWKLTIFDEGEPQNSNLRRDFGTFPNADQLPTSEEVENCLKETPFYIAPWRAAEDLNTLSNPTSPSFANRLEGWYGPGSIHNKVHLWVGGNSKGSMYWMSSPNDPIFFLHHCNIDRLWARWQADHPNEGYHPTGIGQEIGTKGHNLNDSMEPWGGSVTPAKTLDIYALGYTYDTDVASLSEISNHLSQRFTRTDRIIVSTERPHPRFGLSPEDQQP